VRVLLIRFAVVAAALSWPNGCGPKLPTPEKPQEPAAPEQRPLNLTMEHVRAQLSDESLTSTEIVAGETVLTYNPPYTAIRVFCGDGKSPRQIAMTWSWSTNRKSAQDPGIPDERNHAHSPMLFLKLLGLFDKTVAEAVVAWIKTAQVPAQTRIEGMDFSLGRRDRDSTLLITAAVD